MLTRCLECDLPVSDKALACPHCGYPLRAGTNGPRRKSKRMRLPNGFGQISEIKGRNLRNPFRAMVTVGKDSSGRPICKTLKPKGYFSTYNKYRTRFASAMKKLEIEGHRPHDPRKTFVTLCKQAGVDEYAIKYMVGHTISDITESVYTERTAEWLAKELSKICQNPEN